MPEDPAPRPSLRVLIVEDEPLDAERILRMLERDHISQEATIVEIEEDFVAALDSGLDVILADYNLPRFSGLRALELLQASGLQVPLIIVSGTIGESLAAEAIRLGAADYLLKDRLDRLPASIEAAVERRRLSEQRAAAVAALAESEARYRAVSEMVTDFAFGGTVSPDGVPHMEWATDSILTTLGLRVEDIQGRILDHVHPEDVPAVAEVVAGCLTGGRGHSEARVFARDGEARWVRFSFQTSPEPDGSARIIGGVSDIHDRKTAELKAHRLADRLALQRQIEHAVTAATTAEAAAGIMADWLICRFPLDHISVVLFDEHGRSAVLAERHAAGEGVPPLMIQGSSFELLERIPIGDALIVRESDGAEKAPIARQIRLAGVNWVALMPLRSEGKLVGALVAASTEPTGWLPDEDLEAVAGLADTLGVALQHARLLARLEDRAARLNESLDRLQAMDAQRQELLAHVVRAQEEERLRLATDIHDESIQVMAAVGIRLELLGRTNLDLRARAQVDELQRTARHALESLRRLIFDLRPPGLDREGFAPALRTYLEASGGPFRYQVDSRITAEPEGEIRIGLFRIAQEALTNARKHSSASEVRVSLTDHAGGYLLKIADDGTGFAPLPSRPGHIGLTGMAERARMAGGWCRVDSVPGHGTVVEAWLPAEASARGRTSVPA